LATPILSDTTEGSVQSVGAKRKLTAILHADVTGYSRLMGVDEDGTHQALKAHRQITDATIARHGGRIVGTAGDSVLADFPSVVEALSAAVDIQQALQVRNAGLPPGRRLEFRIGVNLGDVIVDGDEIYGDGVNVAARLEALAEPGGIAMSGSVFDQVRNKLDLRYRDRGRHRVKNIAEPIRVYSVELTDRAKAWQRSRLWLSRWRFALAMAVGILLAASALAFWLTPIWHGVRVSSEAGIGLREEHPGRRGDLTRPLIAVLPFDNQSGDPEQTYFSDGVTQDLISALARFGDLPMVSWSAVASYGNATTSPAQLSRELSVRYLVTGSVRRADRRLRVNVQLIDAKRGTLLWSERYDHDVDDLFAVQDQITRNVAGALAAELGEVERVRALTKPTNNLDAYEYVLRGRAYLGRFERSSYADARDMFQRAIDLDPDYGAAYRGLAATYLQAVDQGWTEWPQRAVADAHDLLQKALLFDPADAEAHALLADVYTYRGRFDLALTELDRALQLNPSDAESLGRQGWAKLTSGQVEQAIDLMTTALRFNPRGRPEMFGNLGLAYYLQDRYDDAIATLERGLGRFPQAEYVFGSIALAAAYAQAGRTEDAVKVAHDVRRLAPFFEIDGFIQLVRDPEQQEHIAEGLRKAGFE
jgi:TolB-like protein/class 3 adenylate cyclase/Tfp pilus assembly protein PilF